MVPTARVPATRRAADRILDELAAGRTDERQAAKALSSIVADVLRPEYLDRGTSEPKYIEIVDDYDY
jgi:hypothetical protein